MLGLRIGPLFVCRCIGIKGAHLHLHTLEEQLFAVCVVGRPHDEGIIEQVIELHHPDPLFFWGCLGGVSQPEHLVLACYAGRLNPLAVRPRPQLFGSLAVPLGSFEERHQVDVSNVPLLVPAGGRRVYDDFPR